MSIAPKSSPARLGDFLSRSTEFAQVHYEGSYREITVRLHGKGAIQRRIVKGSELSAASRYVASAGQLIMSKIDARHGALAIVPPELHNAIVTYDFPVYDIDTDRIAPDFLSLLIQADEFVDLCRRSSEGSTNRIRLKENVFLEFQIRLPSVADQRRIAMIANLALSKINDAKSLAAEIASDFDCLLESTAAKLLILDAPVRLLGNVAPLERRLLAVMPNVSYEEIACRSFGRGVFEKPPFRGSDLTWQRPYVVHAGDVLLSNIKAWEGAIAVVPPGHDGKAVSHRYLTLACDTQIILPEYLCFYLLSPQGLQQIGEASPGTADRNRTLSVTKLNQIGVPIPPLSDQLKLKEIIDAKARYLALNTLEKDADALRRLVLAKAFRGEL